MVHQLRELDGLAVLELGGDLRLRTAGQLSTVLAKVLLDRGRVVLDLSGLTVSWSPALMIFCSALARAGGWPLARLVILGADARLTDVLRATRVAEAIPLAESWDEATVLIHLRPPRISRRMDIPSVNEAGVLARSMVGDACTDWGIEPLSAASKLVATELVTNVVDHARTSSGLTLTLTPLGLRISVRDWAPASAAQLAKLGDTEGPGRGLLLVDGLSSRWGVIPYDDGKTVWSLLVLTETRS